MLCCKFLDFLDSPGCTILECDLVQPLVKVDGVLPCDSILHTALLVHHLRLHSVLLKSSRLWGYCIVSKCTSAFQNQGNIPCRKQVRFTNRRRGSRRSATCTSAASHETRILCRRTAVSREHTEWGVRSRCITWRLEDVIKWRCVQALLVCA